MIIYIAISKVISEKSIQLLNESGHTIRYNKNGCVIPDDQLIHLINDVDGVLAGVEKYTSSVLEHATNLKCISRVGESASNIDADSAKKHKIEVIVSDDHIKSYYIAESIMATLLSASRNFMDANNLKNFSIRKMNVTIVGYNEITIKLIQLLEAFGATVYVFDKTEDVPFKYYCSLRREIVQTDALIILSKSSVNMIDKDVISSIKKGAILLDIYGSCIAKDNLRYIINNGIVSLYWTENSIDENIVSSPNVCYTPKSSYKTKQYLKDIEEAAVIQLLQALGQ
jgi:D-3-phosphoglycerate dehydrogenase